MIFGKKKLATGGKILYMSQQLVSLSGIVSWCCWSSQSSEYETAGKEQYVLCLYRLISLHARWS